ncbi:hypothetical protein ZOSMA_83G00430 [Zostera marina]|uniref:UPF3 domain-containing protein n=1 Tax=Zostera marina TaxID=29655 RepID=A0A0K9NNM7_ZOSMR|nr:hypothetical protein ZOSMA_83G00430 [Zostera marina]
MKGGPLERTKVVIRRLPPGILESELIEQIDVIFADRYTLVSFCPGKNSQKNQRLARAYLNFNKPEDIIEFSECFDGHVFVNEKGTQFKASVEYAPSQRVPKTSPKKDGREGTIFKDPEYIEFLKYLDKPVENLPSAEVQLEKREAERAAGVKDAPIVTPLMNFVRQKRAAKSAQRSLPSGGKLGRRTGAVSRGGSTLTPSKCGPEKRKYVLRDVAKTASKKENPVYILASRHDDHHILDKTAGSSVPSGIKALEDEIGTGTNQITSKLSGSGEGGKHKVVLLKAKDRDGNGRIVRSILSKETFLTDQNVDVQNSEKDRQSSLSPFTHSSSRDRKSGIFDGNVKSQGDKASGNDMHYSTSVEKYDRRGRNRDKPHRAWAPHRRLDGSHAGDDYVSSSSLTEQVTSEYSDKSYISQQGNKKNGDDDSMARNTHLGRGRNYVVTRNSQISQGEVKGVSVITRNDSRIVGPGIGNVSITENGSRRHGGRRGVKDDGFMNLSDGKNSKRNVAGYGSHEKQRWVQKTGHA